MKIAKVLLTSQVQHLDRLFDYLIPEALMEDAVIGARVIVPFNNRQNIGFIWEIAEDSIYSELKAIIKVIDIPPLINRVQFELINWIARNYFCNRADVAKLALPPGAKSLRVEGFALTEKPARINQLLELQFPGEQIAETMELLLNPGNLNWSQKDWRKKFKFAPNIFEWLVNQGLLKKTYLISKPKVTTKKINLYKWVAAADLQETAAGLRVREALLNATNGLTRAEICATAKVSASVVKRLAKQGFIVEFEQDCERIPDELKAASAKKEIKFNNEQLKVYNSIKNDPANQLFLLHGITGSGKTEVYFELAADVIKAGKQVLYLVPEISLTPQTLQRARSRFGDCIALLHSNMSDGERFDQWFRIKRGEARFILGARSAIFAPFDSLGLIIVDEEHESTYKQEENPRYHSRRVVEKLAELTKAKVVLGSATPSIESFYEAQTGKYQYYQLTERYNAKPLPEVTIVDMREELKNGNRNILSNQLQQAITETLNNQEQVILLLNRRGHSTFVLCRDCGQSLRCPACEVSLTYHSNETVLRCHYCDYRQKIPDVCPDCKSSRIRYFGNGTQKLEAELIEFYKDARIIRMDLDTTSRKGAHYQIYQDLVQGNVDILLGTQMIAKGLDLPRVTLVGVISADSSLNTPDFRSAERCFQLLTQVAGRAGRGDKTGRVIFQTYNPEHYSLNFAKNHDYLGFYREEIANRQKLQFPPFAEMVKLGFSGLKLEQVIKATEEYQRILQKIKDLYAFEIMGPAPALIEKLQNRYRWQILVKSDEPKLLEQVINQSWREFPFRKYPNIRIIRDRNPYSIL
ncbi:MAG TPA: primosomal protein N' [Bacillota bacterium]|nr:primosomal protein N' [Bacillota bacterium]HOL10464.1 primosomal protein N' [Bacillota bacterium]HPO98165.1 primosomal protein N' [Bacillota bacterium]